MQALEGGNPREAIRLFDKVRQSWGDDADIWYLMGLAHGKLGQMVHVERVTKRALELDPRHFGALYSLANAQVTLGNQEGALENYNKAMSVNPADPAVLTNYGLALGLLGRHEEAIVLHEKAINYHPNYAPAHECLGSSCMAVGHTERAFGEFQKALRLDPRLAKTHHGLGRIYCAKGCFDDAERHFLEAVRLEPNLVAAHIGLSTIARYRGDFEEALRIATLTEKISPDDPILQAVKADVQERKGDYNEAYSVLRRLAEKDQLTPLAIETYAKICRKFDACDEALQFIEMSINAPATDAMERQMLMFAAGNLLDKLGQYDKAFEWYRSANTTVTGAHFDSDELHRNADDLISSFSKEAMASLPRARTGNSRPIFILGMPRSGTSLTEQILASHPDVYGAGELDYMKVIADKVHGAFSGASRSTQLSTLTTGKLTELANDYLEKTAQLNAAARYITDKMPHNFQYIGLINLLFPEARIIHCRRNPLDNGLSIYFQNFFWSHEYANDLKSIGIFYREYNRLMRHWEQVIDIPMLTVAYEDLIENTEAESRRLLAFCDLDWNDAVMKFHTTRRNVVTASYDQVRQPIYKTSRARWKNYEKYIGPLREALGDCADFE